MSIRCLLEVHFERGLRCDGRFGCPDPRMMGCQSGGAFPGTTDRCRDNATVPESLTKWHHGRNVSENATRVHHRRPRCQPFDLSSDAGKGVPSQSKH